MTNYKIKPKSFVLNFRPLAERAGDRVRLIVTLRFGVFRIGRVCSIVEDCFVVFSFSSTTDELVKCDVFIWFWREKGNPNGCLECREYGNREWMISLTYFKCVVVDEWLICGCDMWHTFCIWASILFDNFRCGYVADTIWLKLKSKDKLQRAWPDGQHWGRWETYASSGQWKCWHSKSGHGFHSFCSHLLHRTSRPKKIVRAVDLTE